VKINPGNFTALTNSNGFWAFDSLPIGNYTVTVDTIGGWVAPCIGPQIFAITNTDTMITVFTGLVSTQLCSAPDISINAPFLRPGFSNQRVHVYAQNKSLATAGLNLAYVIVELDSLLTVQGASKVLQLNFDLYQNHLSL
jgi:hypothetical protein